MPDKTRTLFICQRNSGRSQIAEAYLKKFHGDKFEVENAGLEHTKSVNPLVIQVMNEDGIDLSDKKPQNVFELVRHGKQYNHIITVCYESESQCPVFPGIKKRWHWPFPNPAEVDGSESEKLEKVRKIRDMIKKWVIELPENTLKS